MDATLIPEKDLKGHVKGAGIPAGCSYLAIFADHVECADFDAPALEEMPVERLLELRVFCERCEFRAMRATIGEERFACRLADDDGFEPGGGAPNFAERWFDETHFLDIDLKRSDPDEAIYRATGGGGYRLPIRHAEKIRIRNYVGYDSEGVAYVRDFRIVGLVPTDGEVR